MRSVYDGGMVEAVRLVEEMSRLFKAVRTDQAFGIEPPIGLLLSCGQTEIHNQVCKLNGLSQKQRALAMHMASRQQPAHVQPGNDDRYTCL